MLSIFDIFKVGIGPSSSHTMGPMTAGAEFIEHMVEHHLLDDVTKVTVDLYGSLSLTGQGHLTDVATIMGLAGYRPNTIDPDIIPEFIQKLNQTKQLSLAKGHQIITFDPKTHIVFHSDRLPLHENGMTIKAFQGDKLIYANTYYSTGGGFIVDEAHFASKAQDTVEAKIHFPYPFQSANDLLAHCQASGLSLSQLVLQNELTLHTQTEINDYFAKIWQVMSECIDKGLHAQGVLPGPLKIPRRASALYQTLQHNSDITTDPMSIIDWINLFAIAVNEQNAAAGRVVTAPTNGACGIVPAVLSYYNKFIKPVEQDEINRYFLVCGVIGILYKSNASISGAEVGCQGEVGVACSMAAAGLAELMGGTATQVCIAAEIGMEHNLGLTCDPVAGQVQIPCIERNAIASVKAVNSARMALQRTTNPFVSLDEVITTMFATGKDINAKYRETSLGGLAIFVKSCE